MSPTQTRHDAMKCLLNYAVSGDFPKPVAVIGLWVRKKEPSRWAAKTIREPLLDTWRTHILAGIQRLSFPPD